MRSKLTMLLAIATVCVTTAWAGWSPEEQITTSRADKDLRMYNGRKVAVASDGVRHLVWSDGNAVYYNRYYPNSGWTADYKVSGKIKSSWLPAIALDPNGTDIHVVWEGNRHIYHQKCVPGPSGTGGWVGSPRDITPGAASWFRAPAVACYRDKVGLDHIAATWFTWSGAPYVIGFCECVDGTWGEPIYFEDPLGKWPFNPSVAVDPQNRQGEVFLSIHTGSSVYAKRRISGVWQVWEDVTGPGFNHPFIDVDPGTGCPHIVGDIAAGIYHTYRDPDLGWLPVEMISGEDALDRGWPSMAFSNGSAFVAWPETTSSAGGVKYSIGQYGNWSSDWLTHRYYQGDLNSAHTAASPTGDVYTVYRDEVGKYRQIFGRLYSPEGDGGQAEPVAALQSGIELFPNPAKAGHVTVQYTLPRAEQLTATLLDVSGRAVRSSQFRVPGSKGGSFTLDASGLNPGVYILKLKAGSDNLTRKVVIE